MLLQQAKSLASDTSARQLGAVVATLLAQRGSEQTNFEPLLRKGDKYAKKKTFLQPIITSKALGHQESPRQQTDGNSTQNKSFCKRCAQPGVPASKPVKPLQLAKKICSNRGTELHCSQQPSKASCTEGLEANAEMDGKE